MQEGGRRQPYGPNVDFPPPAPSLHPPSFPPPEPGGSSLRVGREFDQPAGRHGAREGRFQTSGRRGRVRGMAGKKSQVVGGSAVALLVVGLVVRSVLVSADRAERQRQDDAFMKREIKSIQREFRMIEQRYSTTKSLGATSRRSDESASQGEAEGKEGGGSEAVPPSDHCCV